jgi:hypothetical protein
VLPVTVRGVEPELGQGLNAIAGGPRGSRRGTPRSPTGCGGSPKPSSTTFATKARRRSPRDVNYTGTKALLAGAEGASRMKLALPGKGKEFEVVGCRWSSPASTSSSLPAPRSAGSCSGRPATRYVSAAALVTDMAVHFKWGRAASLAWVTSLDKGKPVAGAAIRVTDSCTGKQLAAGTTDKGRLLVTGGLPSPRPAAPIAKSSATIPRR